MAPSDSVLDAYWQTPPLARTLATITFTLSISIYFFGVPWYWFFWHPEHFWQIPPQIWRLVTTYLVTPPKLGILFDTYFLYRYTSDLESGHPRFPRKEDLIWYMMFVSGSILTFNYYFDITYSPMHPPLAALILAMCYTVTQDQRGMKTQVYFVTIPAQLLPYCMILLSLFMGHDLDYIILQFEGLLAAHLYDFLTRTWPEFGGGSNWIPTPGFLSRLVNTPRVLQRSYGTAIRSNGASSGRSSGAEPGPLPDSWRTRGSGQRLG